MQVNTSNYLNAPVNNPVPKGKNPALTYNLDNKLQEQNAKTGSNFSVEKQRSAEGAGIILNLLV